MGLPLVWRTKPPPGCLILEDLQTLYIPSNKKLEVWTQYMYAGYIFLSMVATCTSRLSRKFSRDL